MVLKLYLIAIPIILFMSMISASSEAIIYAGSNYSFPIDTIKQVTWDVSGNSSSMEGFEVHQDILDDYSIITLFTKINYKPDEFTLILTSSGEIITKIEFRNRHSTTYVNRTVDKNNTIYLKDDSGCGNLCNFSNKTDTETENIYKPKYNWKITLFFLLVFLLVAWWLFEMEKLKKEGINNQLVDE